MKAVFKEMSIFAVYRNSYLADEEYTRFQQELMRNPVAGRVIRESGGLRKIRWADNRRGKGNRGGVRIVYFWCEKLSQFWLFTIYGKDEADDLSAEQRRTLRSLLKRELDARGV